MSTSMREALEPINMQDVRLVCGEGKLEAKHVLEAVNIILKQRTERAAFSSPAPDRLSEEERYYALWRAAKAVCDSLSVVGDSLELVALRAAIKSFDVDCTNRLSRQPEAEPDAYAEIIGGRVVSCRPDKSPHCTAPLYLTSPHLDRERLARTLYRRLVLNPPADFDDASADLQNEWLQLADAIMRETR